MANEKWIYGSTFMVHGNNFACNAGHNMTSFKQLYEASVAAGYHPLVLVYDKEEDYTDTVVLKRSSNRQTVGVKESAELMMVVAGLRPDEATLAADGSIRLWWD